jgi:hypothetical protein
MTTNTTPSADLSYSTAPIRSVTLFWVTPSLYPIALQHTVRIHPTTDPSNNPLCPHSGDHRPLSKSTTLTLFCINPSHPVPNEALRIISAYLWTSGSLEISDNLSRHNGLLSHQDATIHPQLSKCGGLLSHQHPSLPHRFSSRKIVASQ